MIGGPGMTLLEIAQDIAKTAMKLWAQFDCQVKPSNTTDSVYIRFMFKKDLDCSAELRISNHHSPEYVGEQIIVKDDYVVDSDDEHLIKIMNRVFDACTLPWTRKRWSHLELDELWKEAFHSEMPSSRWAPQRREKTRELCFQKIHKDSCQTGKKRERKETRVVTIDQGHRKIERHYNEGFDEEKAIQDDIYEHRTNWINEGEQALWRLRKHIQEVEDELREFDDRIVGLNWTRKMINKRRKGIENRLAAMQAKEKRWEQQIKEEKEKLKNG